MGNKKVQPGVNLDLPSEYYKLEVDKFQILCRELFADQPDVETCSIFGTRGQSQYGIDLKAKRCQYNEIEVGQCKNYEYFSESEIRQASKDFFDSWDYWQSRNVKRFILFVGSELRRTQGHEEIEKQEDAFQEKGIKYEAWDSSRIDRELRTRHYLVARYFDPPEHFVKKLCGMQLPSTPHTSQEIYSDSANILLEKRLDSLSQPLAELFAGDLIRLKNLALDGQTREALSKVIRYRELEGLWATLDPVTKAQAIRLEVDLTLKLTHNLERSKKLAQEASSLLAPDHEEVRIINAVIRGFEAGPQAVLDTLGEISSLDGKQLQAFCLIGLGRSEEAIKTLDGLDFKETTTLYLRALAYRCQRDISSALQTIRLACKLAPFSKPIRIAYGGIHYFSAISPIAVPEYTVAWPEPPDWSLVRQDDESIRHLKEAEGVFVQLLLDFPDLEKRERQHLEGWRLACLACSSDRRDEAEALALELLSNDNEHTPALLWALARNLPFPENEVRESLQRLRDEGKAEIHHILSLVACFLRANKPEDAKALLSAEYDHFAKVNALPVWRFWRVQTGDTEADLDDSIPRVNRIDAMTHAIALFQKVAKTGSWEPVTRFALTSLEGKGDLQVFLACCETLAMNEQWSFVADHAQELIKRVGTGAAVRIAARALYHSGRLDEVLTVLDQCSACFAGNDLPYDLQQLLVVILRDKGLMAQALLVAEQLVTKYPLTPNLLLQANLHLDMGDREAVVKLAKQLKRHDDIPPEAALKLSSITLTSDRNLSRRFLRKALANSFNDRLAVQALELGQSLGLAKEVEHLFNFVIQAAQKGGSDSVRMINSVEELLQFQKGQEENRTRHREAYRLGTIPLHAGIGLSSVSLPEFIQDKLGQGKPSLYPNEALFLRYGGRGLPSDAPIDLKGWRLYLDLSALLVAESLGVLGHVEKIFRTLFIPKLLPKALLAMQNNLQGKKNELLSHFQRVIQLVKAGSLEVLVALNSQGSEDDLASHAKELGRIPVDNGLKDTLPPSCILAGLHLYSSLSADGYLKALRRIDAIPSDISPPIVNSLLICSSRALIELSRSKLLLEIVKIYRLAVEQSALDDIRRHIAEQLLVADTIKLLDRLRKKISLGLSRKGGAYQFIPGVGELPAQNVPIELACLAPILAIGNGVKEVVWIDDRFLSSYNHVNKAPLIGILEVMDLLFQHEKITKSQYCNRLLRLRQGDVRYIPITSEEILYHLQNAGIELGRVRETDELAVLRRYFARCFFEEDLLQYPPVEANIPNQNGEISFFVTFFQAVNDAIVQIWQDESQEDDILSARSEWILENLYVGQLQRLPKFIESRQAREHFSTLQLADLIYKAISFVIDDIRIGSRMRRRFFNWLSFRILGKRFAIDPHLVPGVSNFISNNLRKVAKNESNSDEETEILLDLQRVFIRDLPVVIKDAIYSDTELLRMLGIHREQSVSYGGVSFVFVNFCSSVEAILRDGHGKIKDCQNKQNFSVVREADEAGIPVLHFESENSDRKFRLKDWTTGALFHTAKSRQESLCAHGHNFDLPKPARNQIITEISAISDSAQRLKYLYKKLEDNFPHHLAKLAASLQDKHRFTLSDLTPTSLGSIRRFLRLPENCVNLSFSERLNHASQALMSEFGIGETFYRLSHLPVRLPSSLLQAVNGMSQEEARSFMSDSGNLSFSPMAKFHLLYLLTHLEVFQNEKTIDIPNLLSRIHQDFLEGGEGKAFVQLLRWVCVEFSDDQAFRAWAPQDRLAVMWVYAGAVGEMLGRFGAPINGLTNFFEDKQNKPFWELVDFSSALRDDVAFPQQVTPETLLLHGLAYSFADRKLDFNAKAIKQNLSVIASLPNSGCTPMPSFPFLADNRLGENALGSFLGDAREEKFVVFLEENLAGMMSSRNLEKEAEFALARLNTGDHPCTDWLILGGIFKEHLPYPELRSQLKTRLIETDFVELLQKDPSAAMAAFRAASVIAVRLEDQLVLDYFVDQVVQLMACIQGHSEENQGWNVDTLLDSAIVLSRLKTSPNLQLGDLEKIFLRLVTACPALATKVIRFIRALCEELPVAETGGLWKTLLQIRQI